MAAVPFWGRFRRLFELFVNKDKTVAERRGRRGSLGLASAVVGVGGGFSGGV